MNISRNPKPLSDKGLAEEPGFRWVIRNGELVLQERFYNPDYLYESTWWEDVQIETEVQEDAA